MTSQALLTGGAGFIGLHLARRLVDRGVEVTLIDDLSRAVLDASFAELRERITFVEHDLTFPLPPEIAERSFSHVFHLAAIVGVRRVSSAPEEVLRTNILATINLLDWCRRRPPEAFFLSSTSEVGDGARELLDEPIGFSEDGPVVLAQPMLPRTTYAVSKLTSELLVAHHARQAGYRARIGRYHNVYGPRMGSAHVIPELMQRAHARVDPFPVWAVDHSRAFCYVDDALSATMAVMDLEHPEPLVVNIGNDEQEVKIGELARLVLELAGYCPVVEPRAAPPGSPRRRSPDLRRLRELCGWRPRVSLAEGLARTWSWYRQ